jgi:hypothetical protein
MRIKYIDNHSCYTAKSFDPDNNVFELKSDDGSTLLYHPILRLDREYDPKQYTFHFLANDSPSCSENSIFQVYIGQQRIGWVFPFQALLSSDHDYAKNPYFLKYAYVATELLLQKIEETNKQVEPEQFYLEDYYNTEYSLLVLSSENTAKIPDFNLEKDYLVGLFKYGYSFSEKGNSLANLPISTEQNRLHIKPIATALSEIPTINYLFREQLPFANSEVMRFHLCYQIIELLIEIIFKDKFEELIAEITETPDKLSDHKDTLSKITGEKERIKELFDRYAPRTESSYRTDLDAACQKLLTASNRKVSSSYYYNLYSVRCLIVHQLYSLSKDKLEILEEINKPFLNIIMDVLFTFQKPSKQK